MQKNTEEKKIENNINLFIDSFDGTTLKQINKKHNDLNGRIKPHLKANMNFDKHFRNELKEEIKLRS